MGRDHQEWLIKADKHSRARFVVEQRASGEQAVAVHLENSPKGAPPRELSCSLESLQKVVARGEELKDSLEFKPAMAVRKPDEVLELPDCRARYYARLTPEGNEQLAVIMESKASPSRGDGGKPDRFATALDRLQTYAEAGHEYREALGHGTRWYPIISIVEPGPDRDTAIARVVAQSTTRTEGMSPKFLSVENGRLYAHKTEGLHAWPEPMSYRPVGAEFEIARTGHPPIDNAIEFAHFHDERLSDGFVLGRWALPGGSPRPGTQVAWGGHQREANGRPLDYLVDISGTSDGRGVPDDAPYVVIQKSANRPFRGEVVQTSSTREEAVAALREAQKTLDVQRTLGPEWSQQVTGMNRRPI